MKFLCVVAVVFAVLAFSCAQFGFNDMEGNRGLRTALMMNAMQPPAPAPIAAPKAAGGDEAGGKVQTGAEAARPAAPAANNNAATMLGFGLGLGE